MTKRVPLNIVVLFFSFFVFLSQPLADNINVNVTIPSQYGDVFDILDYKDFMINQVEAYLESHNLDLGYIIYCKITSTVGSNFCKAITFSNSTDPVTNFGFSNAFVFNSAPGTIGSTVYRLNLCTSDSLCTMASNDNMAWWDNISYYTTGTTNNFIPIYSSRPLFCSSSVCNSNTYTMKYDTYSYQVPVVDGRNAVPTLSELYDVWFPPPSPSDDYPLLTQFFNLFIDKITYVSEYFVSNYVYLYMFSLFILFSFILLLKRRLF